VLPQIEGNDFYFYLNKENPDWSKKDSNVDFIVCFDNKRITLPLSEEKNILYLASSFHHFVSPSNIAISWSAKDVFSYLKGRTEINLELNNTIYDLSIISSYFNFQDRAVAVSSSAVTTFADDGSGIDFNNLQVVYGSEQLYNRVVITRNKGTPQIAEDTDSQNQYGISTLNQDNLLLSTDAQSLQLADFLLGRYSEPEYRFEALEIEMANLTTSQQNEVLGLELTQVVEVKFTPNGIGTAIEKYAQITGITHRTNSISHSVTIGLSTLDYASFVLDDSVFGLLDSGVLGF
jgi:hypothetical protein